MIEGENPYRSLDCFFILCLFDSNLHTIRKKGDIKGLVGWIFWQHSFMARCCWFYIGMTWWSGKWRRKTRRKKLQDISSQSQVVSSTLLQEIESSNHQEEKEKRKRQQQNSSEGKMSVEKLESINHYRSTFSELLILSAVFGSTLWINVFRDSTRDEMFWNFWSIYFLYMIFFLRFRVLLKRKFYY